MTQELKSKLESALSDVIIDCVYAHGELTLHVAAENTVSVCQTLRDDFEFEQLIDLSGVDYSEYGSSSWETDNASNAGFSRAVEQQSYSAKDGQNLRYAVAYHLLSLRHNQRVRVKVLLDAEQPIIPSVIGVWRSADWYEREAFDLFGIMFSGHPDLRRILTDYGFIGHPFRKDFPLIGNVEMRYDDEKKRVVYEPVSIEPRTLVPRVIRDDNRYIGGQS